MSSENSPAAFILMFLTRIGVFSTGGSQLASLSSQDLLVGVSDSKTSEFCGRKEKGYRGPQQLPAATQTARLNHLGKFTHLM